MTRQKGLLYTHEAERIDQEDFAYSQETAMTHAAQNMEAVITGERAFIISGFTPVLSGSQVVVTKDTVVNEGQDDEQLLPGRAILGMQLSDGPQFGLATVNGASSQTLDLSAFASGTYIIYVSFALTPAAVENRMFWHPAEDAGTVVSSSQTEYAKAVPTRLYAGWAVQVQSEDVPAPNTSLPIARVVKQGATLALTDIRDLFFEGRVDQNYALSRPSHDADRSIAGPQTIQEALQQIMYQISEMLGSAWYQSPDIPLNDAASRLQTHGDNIGDLQSQLAELEQSLYTTRATLTTANSLLNSIHATLLGATNPQTNLRHQLPNTILRDTPNQVLQYALGTDTLYPRTTAEQPNDAPDSRPWSAGQNLGDATHVYNRVHARQLDIVQNGEDGDPTRSELQVTGAYLIGSGQGNNGAFTLQYGGSIGSANRPSVKLSQLQANMTDGISNVLCRIAQNGQSSVILSTRSSGGIRFNTLSGLSDVFFNNQPLQCGAGGFTGRCYFDVDDLPASSSRSRPMVHIVVPAGAEHIWVRIPDNTLGGSAQLSVGTRRNLSISAQFLSTGFTNLPQSLNIWVYRRASVPDTTDYILYGWTDNAVYLGEAEED